MALSISTVLFFILPCGLWVAEARRYRSVLSVPNGGIWGEWGPVQFCYKGHAVGFLLKVEPYGTESDSTALNGISLFCDDGTRISSTIAPWGYWSTLQYCRHGKLLAFALRVQEPNVDRDNTAANNIKFLCSDYTELMGNGNHRGHFGPWSNICNSGYVCGIRTRVQPPQYFTDDTTLNDVILFCCE